MAAAICKHTTRVPVACGEAHSRCTWREGQESPCRAMCQLHTKQPSPRTSVISHRCEPLEKNHLGRVWLKDNQINPSASIFQNFFFLCTSPGFIRTKLLVDNYWQHCTLLNTLTEVIQTVYASVMQYINYAAIWQIQNIHCISHGSPPTTTHRNFCLCNLCCESTLNTPAHSSCPCTAQAGVRLQLTSNIFFIQSPHYKVHRISTYYTKLTPEQMQQKLWPPPQHRAKETPYPVTPQLHTLLYNSNKNHKPIL